MIAPYKVATDMVEDEFVEDVRKILQSGRLVLGPYTEKFERTWAGDTGRRRGIACCSDTAALEMVLRTLRVKDKFVLLPDSSFFGVVNVIWKAGGIPVPVPCSIGNGLMPKLGQWIDVVEEIGQLYGPDQIAAALFVYTAGGVGVDSHEAIQWMQKERRIPVVEDCAHCHGATYADGRPAGKYGRFATFSLYATKLIHTGEGGIILVDDPMDASALESIRDYGQSFVNGRREPTRIDGYNWRMTEMQAALGLRMWKKLDEVIGARALVEAIYDETGFREKRLPPHAERPGGYRPNLYRYIVLTDELDSDWKNMQLTEKLKKDGVQLQAKCNSAAIQDYDLFRRHRRSMFEPWSLRFSETPDYCMRHICLPIYPSLSGADARYVADAVRDTLASI